MKLGRIRGIMPLKRSSRYAFRIPFASPGCDDDVAGRLSGLGVAGEPTIRAARESTGARRGPRRGGQVPTMPSRRPTQPLPRVAPKALRIPRAPVRAFAQHRGEAMGRPGYGLDDAVDSRASSPSSTVPSVQLGAQLTLLQGPPFSMFASHSARGVPAEASS